jgi:hypothetical protein
MNSIIKTSMRASSKLIIGAFATYGIYSISNKSNCDKIMSCDRELREVDRSFLGVSLPDKVVYQCYNKKISSNKESKKIIGYDLISGMEFNTRPEDKKQFFALKPKALSFEDFLNRGYTFYSKETFIKHYGPIEKYSKDKFLEVVKLGVVDESQLFLSYNETMIEKPTNVFGIIIKS